MDHRPVSLSPADPGTTLPVVATPAFPPSTAAGDAGDLVRILRRNLWLIALCTGGCVASALLYIALARPSYSAAASVRIDDRKNQEPGATMLGLSGGNEVSTEIEMLRSRMLAEAVVDSLGLQIGLTRPRRALRDAMLEVRHVSRDAATGTFTLTPDGSGRYVLRDDSSGAVLGRVTPGEALPIAGLDVAVAPQAAGHGTLAFHVANFDDAVFAIQQDVTIARRNRDANIVDVTYRGSDPQLVRAIPNLLVTRFIADRQNTQQGENRGLVGFLREQSTRLAGQLTQAEDSLRRYRVAAHIVSLPDQARSGVTGVAGLQAQRNELDAERTALAEMLRAANDSGSDTAARNPIAFPTLLRNQVAATLLGSLADAETRRSDLLSRRSPEDKDVQVLTRRINDLRTQLQSIATTYLQGLTNQIAAIDTTLRQSSAELQTIPAKEIRLAELERNVGGLEQVYALLQSRLKEAEIAQVAQDPTIRQVDTALLPRKPVSPRGGLTLALALIAGLIAGASAALTKENVDRAVHTRRDMVAATGVPVLGVIPHGTGAGQQRHDPDLVYKHEQDGRPAERADRFAPASQAEISEAFVRLSTNLAYARPERPLRALMVTSALPGEGKTTSAVNLALTCAWRGQKVLLVDADLRRGHIHRLFRLPRAPGLSEVLAGARLDEVIRRVEMERGPALYVLTTGALSADASALVGKADLQGLVAQWRGTYDRIVIDTSPVNVVADGTLLAPACDGVIVVARAGFTMPDALEYTLEQLRHLRAPIVGTVLNDIDYRRDGAYRESYQYHDSYLAAQSG